MVLIRARLEVLALGLVMVHIPAAFAMHTDDGVVAVGLTPVDTIQADGWSAVVHKANLSLKNSAKKVLSMRKKHWSPGFLDVLFQAANPKGMPTSVSRTSFQPCRHT